MLEIKEILVLHHSHLDYGYTHTQPVLRELQREFLDEALRLLDSTADWSEKDSQPKWTVEVTAQLLEWLKTSSEPDVERFTQYAQAGRIGVSGFQYNSTPLVDAEGIASQLRPIKEIRQRFGIPITTVNQHDVNGIPWPFVDIALDAGIQLLIMAVNIHFGGSIDNRPSIFKWKSPSGRTLRVMNGAHYTMFDQLLKSWDRNLDTMSDLFDVYRKYLEKRGWSHDFIYLTTAAAPVCWDNSPPNRDTAELIRKWNSEGRTPHIRYITPDELRQRIDEIPDDQMRTLSGDWTDFWNFGAGSTAHAVRISRQAKTKLRTSRIISTALETNQRMEQIDADAQEKLNLFDEHTWGAFNTRQHDHDFARSQRHLKQAIPYEADGLVEYLITDRLEALARNPWDTHDQHGVLVVNPSAETRQIAVPVEETWPLEGKRLRTARMAWPARYGQLEASPSYGPVELAPFSWRFLKFDELDRMGSSHPRLEHGQISEAEPVQRLNINETEIIDTVTGYLESPSHRLEYDMATGRITRLLDKSSGWEVLPEASPYTFFQLVREEPDPLINNHRTALYARNLDQEKYDVSCWQTDWPRRLHTALRPAGNRVETGSDRISLILSFEMPGLKSLEQRITLRADSPTIELVLDVDKEDIRDPESYYLIFPLALSEGWRGHFDTAGIPVELDAEQLPEVSRDWVTVDQFASISHDQEERSAALICPDAPLVMHGGMNFGDRSKTIERKADPCLVGWPFNNYWDTNFPYAQPGRITLRYGFATGGKYSPTEQVRQARSFSTPSEIHPALTELDQDQGRFIVLDHDDAHVLDLKPASTHEGLILTLLSTASASIDLTLTLPHRKIIGASVVNALEEVLAEKIEFDDQAAVCKLVPNRITHVLINSGS